jgi:anti-sigma factor RsiW
VTHRDVELRLDAYVDGELAEAEAREVAAHLAECRECAARHDALVSLRAAIAAQAPYHRAGAELRQRVRAAVRGAGAARSSPVRWAARWRPLAAAATIAVVAFGAWEGSAVWAARDAVARDVLSGHVRSLQGEHLTDVVSTDQHTVKPWFNGRLDFSPPVYDFTGAGFPLVGGRVDYVDGRPVAALVYGRRRHFINVFVWPTGRGSAAGRAAMTRQGYHLRHWTTPGFVYWVVSDLGTTELDQFAGLLRGADAAAP